MGKEEDIRLVERAMEGEEQAFRILLTRYRRSIYTLCVRMTGDRDSAEDLAQEVFIRVFKNLERYDASYAFSSWIFRIATNLCIDHLRKRRPDVVSMEEPLQGEGGNFSRQFVSNEDAPDEILTREEIRRVLEKAIDRLPPRYRTVILLRHQEGLSYEEIAASEGLPLGTVKARIHRARKLLREILEEGGFLDR